MKQNTRAMRREGFALSVLSGHGNIFHLSTLYIIPFDSFLQFSTEFYRFVNVSAFSACNLNLSASSSC